MKKQILMLNILSICLLCFLSCTDTEYITVDPEPIEDKTIDPYLPDPNLPYEYRGYVYSWGDEFNGNTLDESIWGFEQGFIRGNELQYYRKENTTVSDGRLLISGKKEKVKNEFYDPTSGDYRKNTEYSEYTSSSLIGKNKRLFLFGRIEVRAKIDPANGTFPAIWTCGYNKDWPNNGEIDIMEYYLANMGNGKEPVLTSNFCVGGDPNGNDGVWTQKWNSVFTKKTYYEERFDDPDWINKYHVYRMDWDEERISLYVDDVLRNSIKISDFRNFDGSIAFYNPQFMILNLAIKDHGEGVSENSKFEVDYFRVYQKVVDSEKPTIVKELTASNVTSNSCTLSWEASTDNTGIYRYDVYKNGMADGYFVTSVTSTDVTITNLSSETKMEFSVRALDAYGNYSDITDPVVVTTLPEGETPDCPLESGDSNLVPDGTIESLPTELDADLSTYGFSGSWGNAGWGSLRIVSGSAYCGKKCIELKPEGGEIAFPVNWEPNKTYVLRVWMKTSSASFEFSMNSSYGDGTKDKSFTVPNTDSNWQLFEKEFTTGSETTVGSCSFHSWGGTGVAYVDNWELFTQ